MKILGSRVYCNVFVDYDQPLTAIIDALRLDYVHQDTIPSIFPPTASERGRARLDMEVWSFGVTTRSTVLEEIEAAGYRPATLRELLFLALNRRSLIRANHPIGALGSEVKVHDFLRFPFLVRGEGRDSLDFGWSEQPFGKSWFAVSPDWCFAVVKK